MTLDPRTGRPFGDHGTHADALDYINSAIDCAPGEETEFLKAWSDGDLEEWPEYYEWLKDRDQAPQGSDLPLAIGEDAFTAGWKAALEMFDYGPNDYPAELHAAWSAYDPPEHLKGAL